ncbi:hypothetical protein OUZ56_019946 [Daphnia magna]|uniref:Uncharacterized protein n=1 Tax=Daphnia magna TaxID=35525 RepID=A0ABQ9ZD29_9CRUS|nr:hypothetical protein OUZ56_019946 [Daphnia magna]
MDVQIAEFNWPGKSRNWPPLIIKMKNGSSYENLPLSEQNKIAAEIQKEIGSVKNSYPGRGGDLFVQVGEEEAFNRLREIKRLGGQDVDVQLPKRLLYNMGVISNVSIDYEDEEIKTALEEQGVVEARRITRKNDGRGEDIRTNMVQLTFKGEPGQKLTDRTFCKSQQACHRCGSIHKEDVECKMYCVNCGQKDEHTSDDTKCPKYQQLKKEIQLIDRRNPHINENKDWGKITPSWRVGEEDMVTSGPAAWGRTTEDPSVIEEIKSLKKTVSELTKEIHDLKIQKIPKIENRITTVEAQGKALERDVKKTKANFTLIRSQMQKMMDMIQKMAEGEELEAEDMEVALSEGFYGLEPENETPEEILQNEFDKRKQIDWQDETSPGKIRGLKQTTNDPRPLSTPQKKLKRNSLEEPNKF